MNGKRPYMDYPQYRAARRLVHECCNYDNGNCILLDNGEPCVCVQSISYSLLCRWFIAAVLPLDGNLEAALFHRADRKRCTECGGYFLPKSSRGKYCPNCAAREMLFTKLLARLLRPVYSHAIVGSVTGVKTDKWASW